MMQILNTAHAGCMGTKMDGMESILAGIQAGANILEADIRVLPDGDVVLSHNAVKPSAGENLVRLSQVLEAVRPYQRIRLNLDLKSTEKIDAVARILQSFRMTDRAFFTGIDQSNQKDAAERGGGIAYMLNYEPDPYCNDDFDFVRNILEQLKSGEAFGVNLPYLSVTRELVKSVHQMQKSVSVWTVNGAYELSRMIHMGVDSITTRRPDLLNTLLKNPLGLYHLG